MDKFVYLAKENISQIPQTPGVYAFLKGKEILYIGKAVNLRDRVKNHFLPRRSFSEGGSVAFKDNLITNQATNIGYIETQSEIDALLLESQLIKKIQPKYNIMWKDDKNYFYVVITKEKLPRVFLTHQITPENVQYIGPFVDGKAIKTALRVLRRPFPYYTQKKHPKGLCAWCHLELCPGAHSNEKAYKQNIKRLVEVLQGKRQSVLRQLKKEMHNAASAQDFEKAAGLRNQLFALERIVSHAHATPKEQGHGKNVAQELQQIFKTKKQISRIEAYDISNMQGKEATGSCVVFLNGKPAKQWYRKFKIHISGSPNDFAMIEETLSRRMNHAEWPYPDLMIIDGGKGQLSSALKVLQKFKIKVAGLAKQKNELFLPHQKNSILLKGMPQDVQNLLMHIRDEAHRFAITYHKLLRGKKLFLDAPWPK